MENLDKFLANNFLLATITINKEDSILVPSLFLVANKPKKGDYIQIYSVDLEELKSNQTKLIMYMLESFLNSNIILGINYDDFESNRVEIIGEHRKICIKSKSIDIKCLLDEFLKKTEFLKREHVLKKVSSLEKTEKDMHFLISLSKKKTGYTRFFHQFFEYKILFNDIEDKTIIDPQEINLVKMLIKELIKNHFDMDTNKLKQLKDYINDINFESAIERLRVSLDFGNLIFDLCDNEVNLKIILKIFEEIINDLILENNYEKSKQLVMKI